MASGDSATENAVRAVVITGVSEIPEAGGVASGLLGILWPESSDDVWGSIKTKVEALIQKKLAEYEYQVVCEDLVGLKNVSENYIKEVQHTNLDYQEIRSRYISAVSAFDLSEPHFKSQGYEVLLLPLFTNMANIYISLLYDGVLYGKSWGWNSETYDDNKTKLIDKIAEYQQWVHTWYTYAVTNAKLVDKAKEYRAASNWSCRNNIARGLEIQVKDISFYWRCYDPTSNVYQQVPKNTREIYSDLYGNLPYDPTTKDTWNRDVLGRVTRVTMWAQNAKIYALQMKYQDFKTQKGEIIGPYYGKSNAKDKYPSGPPPKGMDVDINPSSGGRIDRTSTNVAWAVAPSSGAPSGIYGLSLRHTNINDNHGNDKHYTIGNSGIWKDEYQGNVLSNIIGYFYASSNYGYFLNTMIYAFRQEDSFDGVTPTKINWKFKLDSSFVPNDASGTIELYPATEKEVVILELQKNSNTTWLGVLKFNHDGSLQAFFNKVGGQTNEGNIVYNRDKSVARMQGYDYNKFLVWFA
jgi:hypothetical protein